MSQLVDLVDPAAIRLEVGAGDRTAAIRAAGDLLTAVGAASEAYTESMLRAVEQHGPYIVITPGFALAHARPDDSVHRTALSFVRLSRPVEFGHASNDPVTIVMGLAAVDASAHQQALAQLATVLADPASRAALDTASSPEVVLATLAGSAQPEPPCPAPVATLAHTGPAEPDTAELDDAVPSKNLVLTVCGNGLGTSLFLKNTAEQVLDRWGWSPYLTIEATDTISAKGRAGEADALLTSGAIAQTLGDVGVPVEVVDNFTSQAEVDAALRRIYAV